MTVRTDSPEPIPPQSSELNINAGTAKPDSPSRSYGMAATKSLSTPTDKQLAQQIIKPSEISLQEINDLMGSLKTRLSQVNLDIARNDAEIQKSKTKLQEISTKITKLTSEIFSYFNKKDIALLKVSENEVNATVKELTVKNEFDIKTKVTIENALRKLEIEKALKEYIFDPNPKNTASLQKIIGEQPNSKDIVILNAFNSLEQSEKDLVATKFPHVKEFPNFKEKLTDFQLVAYSKFGVVFNPPKEKSLLPKDSQVVPLALEDVKNPIQKLMSDSGHPLDSQFVADFTRSNWSFNGRPEADKAKAWKFFEDLDKSQGGGILKNITPFMTQTALLDMCLPVQEQFMKSAINEGFSQDFSLDSKGNMVITSKTTLAISDFDNPLEIIANIEITRKVVIPKEMINKPDIPITAVQVEDSYKFRNE